MNATIAEAPPRQLWSSSWPPMQVDMTTQVIDFFSGCGGTSAGLALAGLEVVAGVDLDRDASKTFRLNFPDAKFFEADIRTLAPDSFDALVDPTKQLVVSACAPCQPFSAMRAANARSRSADRSLLLQLIPYIERLRPEVVLVENVPGLQRVPGGSTWNRFTSFLKRLGYSIEWAVIDCRNYGVPQRRQRLVLLASRVRPLSIPERSHGVGERPFSTVRDWIGHLPSIAAGEVHPGDPLHRSAALGPLNLARIKALEEGGSRSEWPTELWLDCHRDARGHQDAYGRMRFDATAPVLTTKCTDISNGRYGHPEQDRGISVREAALLQTFPEQYSFAGSYKSITRQIGNAVPVELSRAMGIQILRHLREASAQR